MLTVDFESLFSGSWKLSLAHLASRALVLLPLAQHFVCQMLFHLLLAYIPALFHPLYLNTEAAWPLFRSSQSDLRVEMVSWASGDGSEQLALG